jgi:Fe-S cluster assembly iron-binding protein IscA
MLTVTDKAQEKIREVLAGHEEGSPRLIRVYLRGYG